MAVERIGMPESQIILAQACTYVATAPKSNTAYHGIELAMDYVAKHRTAQVPPYLQDAHYKDAAKLDRGQVICMLMIIKPLCKATVSSR